MLSFDGFRIDRSRRELHGPDGQAVKLRPKSFDMLSFMAENAGRVVTKNELMDRFWPGVHVGEDSLFQCIREIRTALGDDSRQKVKNISGRGYRFDAVVTREDAAPSHTEAASAIPVSPGPVDPPSPAVSARPQGRSIRRHARAAVAATALLIIVGLIAVLQFPSHRARETLQSFAQPTVSVAEFTTAGTDPQDRSIAAGVTEGLNIGLARIENIRVLMPTDVTAKASAEIRIAPKTTPDFIVTGELEHREQSWIALARMTRVANGEVVWVSRIEVSTAEIDARTQESRLTAGVGHPLAVRINALANGNTPSAATPALGSAQVAVRQATASINQTTPERFRAAQVMLETALKDAPDDVDLQAALASLQLRGIQMVWYVPEEREKAKASAAALLERALKSKPSYLPVLESYCRFLSANNRFAESMVACARTLSFDPWNGIALYHIGLNQIFLGRFDDALASFKEAYRNDTPVVSRWTWLLGAGISSLYLDRNAEAALWLERSLAVTPGTGRTHLTLAVAYQRLGRLSDARAMVATAQALRPGATASNITPPTDNTSPVFLAAAKRVEETLVEIGLPER